MAERVQLSRRKGWKLPPNTVKVDRTTAWGNPFRVGEKPDARLLSRWMWKLSPEGRIRVTLTAAEAVERFRQCLAFDDASYVVALRDLRGKNLACWCKPGEPCHADVLLALANSASSQSDTPMDAQ